MTRLFLSGLIFVAVLPRANGDTSIGYLPYAPLSSSGFFGDSELNAIGLVPSETGEPACLASADLPFPAALPPDSTVCETTKALNLSAKLSVDSELTEPLFLLSVIPMPKAEGESLIASAAASATPPQDRFGAWVLITISTAIALIGGTRFLKDKIST
jgi:hypothetical protein